MIWSYLFGYVRNSLWLSFTINGMRWAYVREIAPMIPSVEANALQPPSSASRTRFSGSKYRGFGAKLAPPECSMPWSTGRMLTYPVPPRRPWSYSACRLRWTCGLRSVWTKTRSMKSGPGRCRSAASNVVHLWFSRSWASSPRSSSRRELVNSAVATVSSSGSVPSECMGRRVSSPPHGASLHRAELHDRDRGGADDLRRPVLRPGQRDRVAPGGRTRGRDQARAHGVRAGDLHGSLRQHGRGGAAAARAAPPGQRGGGPQGARDRLGRDAPVRDVGGPADRRPSPLPRPHQRAALRRAPRDHLRPARARRARRRRQGDPRGQRHARARADPA